MKTILAALGCFVLVQCTLCSAESFFDDFNRPDSTQIGNGWSNTSGNSGGDLAIKNRSVTTTVPNGAAGIFRPFGFAGPITVSGVVTEMNGFGGLLRRYGNSFAIRNDGTIGGGYAVGISRADQSYDSNVTLTDQGVLVGVISSPFQFGPQLNVQITFLLDGSVTGTISEGSSTFNFSFGPRVIQSAGNNFSWVTSFPDGRSSTLTFPTLDNISLATTPSSLNDTAATLADSVVGAPYLWGGKGLDLISGQFVSSGQIASGYNYWNGDDGSIAFGNGLDCSGLVMWSYNKAAGATQFPDDDPIQYESAASQYLYNTIAISEADLQPGDLLFFYNLDNDNKIDHVAMYVGGIANKNVVEAANPGLGIIYSSKDALKSRPGFYGFRRVIKPQVGLRILAHSPVDLWVTDPDGYMISPYTFINGVEEPLTEIPGQLYYSQYTTDDLGTASPMVTAPALKSGDYLITVTPKTSALPTDVFGVDVDAAGTNVNLAQNVLIRDIPVFGYGIRVTGQQISTFVPVSIEIKPGTGFPVSINRMSQGTIPVAILSTQTFDATQVNPATLRLAGALVTTKPNGTLMESFEDLNGDGLLDLIVHFNAQDLQLPPTANEVTLEGSTRNGILIKGTEAVQMVPSRNR